ncbi:MAG: hypothetical protein KAS39_06205 [Actinomycetia bacterium]|nr:hypothetical protein [Actinomycetes bacterium]
MIEYLPENQCKLDPGGCSGCLVNGEYSKCKYGIKNSNIKRCSYFKFDEYCDCLKAQIAANPASYSS